MPGLPANVFCRKVFGSLETLTERRTLLETSPREVRMRNFFTGVIVALMVLAAATSVSQAGPHGCYSSHCGKHP
jgi:hypothetical protein